MLPDYMFILFLPYLHMSIVFCVLNEKHSNENKTAVHWIREWAFTLVMSLQTADRVQIALDPCFCSCAMCRLREGIVPIQKFYELIKNIHLILGVEIQSEVTVSSEQNNIFLNFKSDLVYEWQRLKHLINYQT